MKYFSETSFYTFEREQVNPSTGKSIMVFKTSGGNEVGIGKDYVEKYLDNSVDYTSTKKVSRREMIEIVVSNPKTAMTISFNKKLKNTDVAAEAMAYLDSTTRPSKTGMAKALSLKGEDRVMVGHHYTSFTEEGRLNFIDAEAEGMPVKQVDTRTIYEVIVGNVKYVLK